MLRRLVALMTVEAQVIIMFSKIPTLSPRRLLSNVLPLAPNLNVVEWPMLLNLLGLSPF